MGSRGINVRREDDTGVDEARLDARDDVGKARARPAVATVSRA